MTSDKQEFARRLYRLMQAKGMKQIDLAHATGLSRNNIATYVNGNCYPTQRSLELLATALGCKPDDLIKITRPTNGHIDKP